MEERHTSGRWDWTHETGVRLIFDNITPHRDGLKAWIEIRLGDDDPLVYGTKDLRGARTVTDVVRDCTAAYPRIKVDWRELIAGCILRIIRHAAEGDPPLRLSEVTVEREHRWLLRPLVANTGVTSLIGWGGSLKSILALAAAATIASGDNRYIGGIDPHRTGPVLYLDWEADKETHHERLAALCKHHRTPLPDNIMYRQEALPLYQSAGALERRVAAEGIMFGVVDSVMMARGGDAMGPEETVRLYQAARQIGIPWLFVDHVTKASKFGDGTNGAYGSIVNENLARLQWQIVAAPPQASAVRMKLHKANNVGRVPDQAFSVDFDDTARTISIRRRGLDEVEVQETPVRERIMQHLAVVDRAGATRGEIAEALGADGQVISNTLSRMKGREARLIDGRWFLNVSPDDLPIPW